MKIRRKKVIALLAALNVMGFGPLSAYSESKSADGQSVELVDVLQVRADDPQRAVKQFKIGKPLKQLSCDVLVVGGGVGGVAAALQALKAGMTVCLTEETDWLGGQMTAQGVSALDENYLVDISGASSNYQELRKAIRSHYLNSYKLSQAGIDQERPISWTGDTTPKGIEYFNPGNCWVSWLAFEPKVAIAEIEKLFSSYVSDGSLTILKRHKAISTSGSALKVQVVNLINLDDGMTVKVKPKQVVDATECGDLLPMAKVPYVSGAESRKQTSEPHAPENADAETVQDYVFPFVVEFCPGENHTIEKPAGYEQFLEQGKYSLEGYKMFTGADFCKRDRKPGENAPFWTYRRLIDYKMFANGSFGKDIAMINWSSNDLRGKNIIDKPAATMAERLAEAKQLSLGFLYWLQTEAPRDDGGKGYPEMQLRKDVMATEDGLSKYPYIREGRRIVAHTTVTEQDIASATNKTARAKLFHDSVGIGLYPIDIHGHQEVPGAGQFARPFQIPLGSLITKRTSNIIPAAKNIGTTHVSNGAYRLHPVEWGIGEAAGIIAAYCAKNGIRTDKTLTQLKHLRQIQKLLVEQRIPIYWYKDIATNDPDFAAIQFLSAIGALPSAKDNLLFDPEQSISRSDARSALACVLVLQGKNEILDRIMKDNDNESLVWSDLAAIGRHRSVKKDTKKADNTSVSRRDFAAWLYLVATDRKYMGKV